MIEDFFGMIRVLIQVTPETFVSSGMTPSIVACGLACLKVEQLDPLNSTLDFFIEMFGISDANTVQNMIKQHGSDLLNALMSGILDTFPRDRELFGLITDLIFIWAQKSNQCDIETQLLQQMYRLIQSMNEEVVNGVEKQEFMKKMSE